MAIQNFLSGGFYGSIGELTGRRWKNKRVVQRKFKPKNPRTEAQQAWRGTFARGNELAKIGQQVNFHAIQFESPIHTDWNQRVSIATDALKNGALPWEALPLAPVDFKTEHQIGECRLQSVSPDNTAQFVLTGTNLIAGKKYSAAVFIQSGERENDIIVGTGEADATDATLLTLRFDDISGVFDELCYIKIASIDDDTVETVTLSAGILIQTSAESPYIFSPEIVSIELTSLTNLKIQVKLGEEPIESYEPFQNTSVLLYGFYWSKETAVNDDDLTETNRTAFSQSFAVARHSVAKSTAILSLNIESELFQRIEKFALKADIEIHAENVKSETSAPTSETLYLSAQELPEYLQELPTFTEPFRLREQASVNVQSGGKWYMIGDVFATNDQTDAGKVLYMSTDYDDLDWEDSDVTFLENQSGQQWSGDDAYDLYQDNGLDFFETAQQIYFGIDNFAIKNWHGFFDFVYWHVSAKIAFAGYRTYNVPISSGGSADIYIYVFN